MSGERPGHNDESTTTALLNGHSIKLISKSMYLDPGISAAVGPPFFPPAVDRLMKKLTTSHSAENND